MLSSADAHLPEHPDIVELYHANRSLPGCARSAAAIFQGSMHPGGRPRSKLVFTDEDLAGITTPTLFVWGDREPYGPVEVARRAAAHGANAHVEVITAGGTIPGWRTPQRARGCSRTSSPPTTPDAHRTRPLDRAAHRPSGSGDGEPHARGASPARGLHELCSHEADAKIERLRVRVGDAVDGDSGARHARRRVRTSPETRTARPVDRDGPLCVEEATMASLGLSCSCRS
jgi:hypothetical protein